MSDELIGITRYDICDVDSNHKYLEEIALDVCSQWDGYDDNQTQRVCAALVDALARIRILLDELDTANQLSCPTCGFPVDETNRNGLYIAARCDWCNEIVHIEKE